MRPLAFAAPGVFSWTLTVTSGDAPCVKSGTITVLARCDGGDLLGTKTLSVRAFEQSRLDKIHQTLAIGPVAHGAMSVEVNTPGALLHAYALLIDNLSGDPAFMPVELVPR